MRLLLARWRRFSSLGLTLVPVAVLAIFGPLTLGVAIVMFSLILAVIVLLLKSDDGPPASELALLRMNQFDLRLERERANLGSVANSVAEVRQILSREQSNLGSLASGVAEVRELITSERHNLGLVAEAVDHLKQRLESQVAAAQRSSATFETRLVVVEQAFNQIITMVEADNFRLELFESSMSELSDKLTGEQINLGKIASGLFEVRELLSEQKHNLGLVAGGIDALRRSTAGSELALGHYVVFNDALIEIAQRLDRFASDPSVVPGGAKARRIAAVHKVEASQTADAVRRRLTVLERPRAEVDLIMTHTEICSAHGTGVLMSRILEEAPPYVHIRSFDNWGGQNDVKAFAEYVFHRFSEERATIAEFISARLRFYIIKRIVVVPYTREDVIMALTAKAITGAPMTIWVMDDNTLFTGGVPTQEYAELLRSADARFAISEDLRDAYEAAFGVPFWVLPPLVGRHLLRKAPSLPPHTIAGGKVRAVILGNIWHQGWLDKMLDVLVNVNLAIDWYTSIADPHFLRIDPQRLAAAGIHIRNQASAEDIAEAAAAASFALLPSTSLAETDLHAAAIGRLSLPSKMPFVTAAAGTPFLVLADGPSAAANYVERFKLGETAPYEVAAIRIAIARLTEPHTQDRIRAASFDLSAAFDVTGAYQILTSAAELGRHPAQERFGKLFCRSK